MFLRFLTLFIFISNASFAGEVHNLDDLFQNDRETRILEINRQSIELNRSLDKLEKFKNELRIARQQSKQNEVRVTVRNATAIVAVVGFVSTIVFQSKHINASGIILGGGYTVSALAAIISLLEHQAITFTPEEVEDLIKSISGLEKIVLIQKRNLAIEVRILCMEEGGNLELCSN